MLTAATTGERREEMTQTNTELAEQLAAVSEGTRDIFLDLLLEHWPRIAATAWEGWLVHGRCTVTIENGSVPPVLAYRPGAPCPCHACQVEAYDPERGAVVAVVEPRGGVPWIGTSSGERRSAATDWLRAASSGATVH
jgi:hypothetical protein